MARRTIAMAAAAALLAMQCGAIPPARADNQMGYRMMSSQEAAGLSPGGATLGISVASTQRINEQGLNFSVLTVTQVRPGSPAMTGGIQHGDMLIAVNGLVFPGIREFAQYVSSLTPGTLMTVDFIPRGTGPDNAQRITLRVGGAGQAAQSRQGYAATSDEPATGMSTRMKLGLGAAALFGCYELGCFSHGQPNPQQQQAPQQNLQRQ